MNKGLTMFITSFIYYY